MMPDLANASSVSRDTDPSLKRGLVSAGVQAGQVRSVEILTLH